MLRGPRVPSSIGDRPISPLFSYWSGGQEENWRAWKEMRPAAPESHLRRLFCADAFAHYFQMLAHALPDELPLFLYLDTRGCGSAAEKRQLRSRERFEHFHVVTEESAASLAVCMPEEAHCSGDALAKLDRLFAALKEPYRVIEETFLTESWEGVDRLYVVSEAISAQGKRKLMGFCAAGGSGDRGRGAFRIAEGDFRKRISGQRDLNPRPTGPKPVALAKLRYTPLNKD